MKTTPRDILQRVECTTWTLMSTSQLGRGIVRVFGNPLYAGNMREHDSIALYGGHYDA